MPNRISKKTELKKSVPALVNMALKVELNRFPTPRKIPLNEPT